MTTTHPLEPLPTSLVIRLFGSFQAEGNGGAVPTTQKERWLLALLLLHPHQALERRWLAGVFWPDSTQERALQYLRRSLSQLRSILGPDAWRLTSPTPRTLRLQVSGLTCDVLAFDAAIASQAPTDLQQAITLYRGPLLQECHAEWLLPERRAREAAYQQALQTLAQHAHTRHNEEEAVSLLRRLLMADPLRESGVRSLMQALAQQGDYAALTQVYREFRLRLHDELQAQPDAETSALYRSLRSEARERARPLPSVAVSSAPASLRHLPAQPTALIGREAEIEQGIGLLQRTRLLTLTGTGGVGKTRLALAVAEEVAQEYEEGVCFVDLSALQESDRVVQVVASALQVREKPRCPLQETLIDYLQARSLLLLLDNCEHLLSGCAPLVKALLGRCPQMRLLATSRQPLGVVGERIWRVPSLSLPEKINSQTLSEKGAQAVLMESEAVQLFVERAASASTAFRLTRENLGSVSEICILLDGIPLALELAAAWVRIMPIEQTAARLRDRMNLLQSRQPGRRARHETLRETLDWSYGLLPAAEQTLLHRLSVFSGGWTLEAVEAVCAEDEEVPDGVLLRLAGLVDRSLVEYTDSAGTGRYRLLETTRQYARDKLRQSGEEAGIQQQHLVYFVQAAERASEELRNCQPAVWHRVMDSDRMNFQSALAWALDGTQYGCTEASGTPRSVSSPRSETALRLCAALWNHWDDRGYLQEGRVSLRRALERADATRPTRSYGAALLGAGTLAYRQGDLAEASAFFADTVEVGRALGDAQILCSALNSLATQARIQGQMDRARSLFEELLEVARNTGYVPGEAGALGGLGLVFWSSDLVAARSAIEQSLDLFRGMGWRLQIATSLMNLATTVKMQGDRERAQTLYEECLSLYQAEGTVLHLAGVFSNLGHLSNERGELRAATRYHREALAIWGRNDDVGGILWCLEALAVSLEPQGLAVRSARLLGAAEALRELAGHALTMPQANKRCVDQTRTQLGEAACAAVWAEGRAMTLKQVVAYALQDDDPDGLDA